MELLNVISFSVAFLDIFIVSIHCTNKKRPVDDQNAVTLNKFWNEENKKRLLKIYYETKTNERGHRNKIKEQWDQLHGMKMPHSAHNLYIRATTWIDRGDAERLLTEEERQCENFKPRHKKMKWTPEMMERVLEFYHMSDPKQWRQAKRIKELWDKEYPQYSEVKGHHLMSQVRNMQKKRGDAFNAKKIFVTREEKEDILRCYYMAPKKRGEQLKMMRQLFIEKHPEFANVSYDALRHQIVNFRKKHPEIDERISREVSSSYNIHHSWSLGGTSGLKQDDSPYNATYQRDDLHRGSDQYLRQDYDDPWIHDMTGRSSSSSHHISPDVGTSHQNIPSSHFGEHSSRGSEQYNRDKEQRKSSKGKEPALDLDLHLR